jgi:GMP synthase PP-ATPase subunit
MYVANCSVNGNCRVYAWLIAVLAVVSLLSMAASVSLLKTNEMNNNLRKKKMVCVDDVTRVWWFVPSSCHGVLCLVSELAAE